MGQGYKQAQKTKRGYDNCKPKVYILNTI